MNRRWTEILAYFLTPFPSTAGFSAYRFPGMAVHLPAWLLLVYVGYYWCWAVSWLHPLLVVHLVAGWYLGRDLAIMGHYGCGPNFMVWSTAGAVLALGPLPLTPGELAVQLNGWYVPGAVLGTGAVLFLFIANLYLRIKEREGYQDESPTAPAPQTPLLAALEARDETEAARLIAAGENLAQTDAEGLTALHWAVSQGMIGMVRLLLEAGAEVNAGTEAGATPLLGLKDAPILDLETRRELARLLLVHGADPAVVTPDGETILHQRAADYVSDLIEPAVQAGISVNTQDQWGYAPLHLAAANLVVASRLVELGADVNSKSIGGRTPLHSASAQDGLDGARFLLEHGAKIHATDADGRTALHLARSAAMAQLLIQAGANPQAKDQAGLTPLHSAARYCVLELVQLLLDNGASPDQEDNEGRTPMDQARESGWREGLRLLKKYRRRRWPW